MINTLARNTAEYISLHVEEAEDKLVQNTETAIGLMKAVLENVSDNEFILLRPQLTSQPEPLQNLSNLVKAQLIFHSTAAETLSVSFSSYEIALPRWVQDYALSGVRAGLTIQGIQSEMEEAATAAEAEYRQSRGA